MLCFILCQRRTRKRKHAVSRSREHFLSKAPSHPYLGELEKPFLLWMLGNGRETELLVLAQGGARVIHPVLTMGGSLLETRF